MSETNLRQKYSLTIPGELLDLNEYIRKERSSAGRYVANTLKQEQTEIVAWIAKEQLRNVVLEQPCFVEITWFCKNAKKDPDNIVFAKKFVMDGLVMAGVLKNDTMRYILGFMDMVNIDRTNPRIEINLLTLVLKHY